MSAKIAVREEQTWVEPRADFYLQSGSAFENPYGVPHDELIAMCMNGSPEVSAQTVFGMYVPSSGLVFSSKLILNLLADPVVHGTEYVDEETLAHRLIEEQHYGPQPERFKGGGDLARKKDSTVVYVLDTLPLHHGGRAKVVYYRTLTRVPWEVVYAEIGRAAWMWNAHIKLDSTGAGDVVLSELQTRDYCPTHHMTVVRGNRCVAPGGEPLHDCRSDEYHRIDVTGFEFTTRSKVQLVTHLSQCLGHNYDEQHPEKSFGRIVAPSIARLRVQLGGYMWDDKKLETDEVMSLAIAAWHGVRDTPGAPAQGPVH